MISLDHPTATVRRLLRLLRRPHLLERDYLALRLRQTLQTAKCRDALVQLIDQTFADFPDGQRLREIIVRCDVGAQKARAAAAGMNLSLRQFYRCRAEAIDALAISIERIDEVHVLGPHDEAPIYCSACHKRILRDTASSGGESRALATQA